jgi:5,6,7,8-tetrahydromethanopterin hydro-lyase
MSVMYVGEGLVIENKADGSLDLDNVAHIDLLIGPKDGPVGVAFGNALANQSAGHTNLLAVVSPNIQAKPATAMITKVTLKGSKQVMQMFGPAQAAVARAVVDSVVDGVIPKSKAEEWVIVCGVFIAGSANSNAKIYKNNYEATKLAIKNAINGTPTIDEIIAKKETAHPFEK